MVLPFGTYSSSGIVAFKIAGPIFILGATLARDLRKLDALLEAVLPELNCTSFGPEESHFSDTSDLSIADEVSN